MITILFVDLALKSVYFFAFKATDDSTNFATGFRTYTPRPFIVFVHWSVIRAVESRTEVDRSEAACLFQLI
uniref:Secreted protein n=1 Tax=Steinernema glaseri TaxID=37863 RepID=A0A1I8AAV0_9BILA